MSRVLFLLKEAMISLRRNVLVVTGAVLAVFISLSLALGALVVNEVLRVTTIAWQEGVHAIVFLSDEGANGIPVGAHQALVSDVRTWEEVKEARYFDKTQAWAEYQEIFSGQPELLDIDPSILPASIRIELTDIDLHSSVTFKLQERGAIVRSVVVSSETIQQMQQLRGAARIGGLTFSLVLGVAAVVLIANTIRLAIYARRDEVSIMKLVGASNWFIRVPFLLEGLIEGVIGAGLAVFVVWLGSRSIAQLAAGFELFQFEINPEFFFRWGLLFLIFGALAGVIGSMLGLGRYLRDAEGTGPDVPTGF